MSATLDPSLAADPTPAAFAEALNALEDAHDSRLAAEALASWEARGRPAGIAPADIARELGIDLTAEPDAAP
jgi:hypothetical protein